MLTLYAPDYATVPVVNCSPPSWMAHVLLEEKQLEYRVKWLSFTRGEHKTPAMLARNPRGTIPVLEDGDVAVHETLAILEYIELSYPQPALLPPGRNARARALTRLHESAYVKDAGMAVFRRLMRRAEGEPEDREIWAELDTELARWDAYLADGEFTGGDELGLADLVLFTYVATAKRLGYSLAARENLAGHYERMTKRPSVTATWPSCWS